MAYSSHGGFDFLTEMTIVRDFAHGLDAIACAFIKRAEQRKVDEDDELSRALQAQAALVADRLSNILADLEKIPFDKIYELDRLASGMPKDGGPVSNVTPMKPRRNRPTKRVGP